MPDYCVEEVSDHAVGFALAWTRGIVGFGRIGRIGRATARKLGAFGCRLLAHDPHLSGTALDVLESEPDVPSALLAQPGAMLTPHVAFSSDVSLLELRRRAAEEGWSI